MNTQRNIAGQGRHFNGEHTLGNQLASSGADDADAEHTLCVWIDE